MSTTYTCPNGHESADAEWCDTCGAKIGGETVVPSAPAAPATTVAPVVGSAQACPHCHNSNPADALFCEVCGYDFTTGQAPAEATPVPTQQAPHDDGATVAWIAVVEVDPVWYTLKGTLSDAALPQPSSSTVPIANHTTLIGRTSASRGLHPEIALDADTGVSRRHAQLVRDGDHLTVVDLSSTNGTYVIAAGEEPRDESPALVAGVPCELHDGDRLYVGAWSRLTVRSSPALAPAPTG